MLNSELGLRDIVENPKSIFYLLNQDEKDYLVMATPYIFEVFDTLSEKAVQELNSFISEF